MLIVGSVCSGIGAPECAWHSLGWRSAFASEIEAFPRAVLAHRFPAMPVHGDFTTIEAGQYDAIDLLVGGTPCQSFSVAGLRKGLADERGNLALEYLRLADRLRPRWVVWENVPGVLSSNGGRDFGAFLGGLVQLRYGFAYRILDAQYFGVAQRRRRVFVVGYLGDWRRAAAVLFEPHSMQGHPAPRREAGQRRAPSVIKGAAIGRQPSNGPQYGEHLSDGSVYTLNCTEQHAVVAPTISARTRGVGGLGTDFDCDGGSIPSVAHALNAGGMRRQDYETETFVTIPTPTSNGDAHSEYCDEHGLIPTTYSIMPQNSGKDYGVGLGTPSDPSFTLLDAHAHAVQIAAHVRRLTPRECERLQGFPDDWTLVPYRRGQAGDSPRYKALGNSMAVPVMRWIGERIEQQEALVREMTMKEAV